jgi:hypothetical protein
MRYVYGVLAVIIVAAGCIGADAAWISAEYLSDHQDRPVHPLGRRDPGLRSCAPDGLEHVGGSADTESWP